VYGGATGQTAVTTPFTYAGKVQALRPAEVNDAAKSILHPDNLVWVVVGDRVKIEQGVRELNIGECAFWMRTVILK